MRAILLVLALLGTDESSGSIQQHGSRFAREAVDSSILVSMKSMPGIESKLHYDSRRKNTAAQEERSSSDNSIVTAVHTSFSHQDRNHSSTPISSPTSSPFHSTLFPATFVPSLVTKTARPTIKNSSSPITEMNNTSPSKPRVEPSFVPTVLPSRMLSPVSLTKSSQYPTTAPNQSLKLPTKRPSVFSPYTPTSGSPNTFRKPSLLASNSTSGVPPVQLNAFPSLTPSVTPHTSPSQIKNSIPSKVPSLSPISSSGFPSVTSTVLYNSTQHTPQPSSLPSDIPSLSPSSSPSRFPSIMATTPSLHKPSTSLASASSSPTDSNSEVPSDNPSLSSSLSPSALPSVGAVISTTTTPHDKPSISPTQTNHMIPSDSPSLPPSLSPSGLPSSGTVILTTTMPNVKLSISPTQTKHIIPSDSPSLSPSVIPSSFPSIGSVMSSPSPISSKSLLPSLSDVPSVSPTRKSLASDYPSLSPSLTLSGLPSVGAQMSSKSPAKQPPFFTLSDLPSISPTTTPSTLPRSVPSSPFTTTASESNSPNSPPPHIPTVVSSFAPSNIPSTWPTGWPRYVSTNDTFTINSASSIMDTGNITIFENTAMTFLIENMESVDGSQVNVTSVTVVGQFVIGSRRRRLQQANKGLEVAYQVDAVLLSGHSSSYNFRDQVATVFQSRGSDFQRSLSEASPFFPPPANAVDSAKRGPSSSGKHSPRRKRTAMYVAVGSFVFVALVLVVYRNRFLRQGDRKRKVPVDQEQHSVEENSQETVKVDSFRSIGNNEGSSSRIARDSSSSDIGDNTTYPADNTFRAVSPTKRHPVRFPSPFLTTSKQRNILDSGKRPNLPNNEIQFKSYMAYGRTDAATAERLTFSFSDEDKPGCLLPFDLCSK